MTSGLYPVVDRWPVQRFHVGNRVKAIRLTDRPEIGGLTVTETRLIDCLMTVPYYRLRAKDGCGGWVEGAERFFEFEVKL